MDLGNTCATAGGSAGLFSVLDCQHDGRPFVHRMPERVPLTSDETARYSRHIILPEIGLEGQERLKGSSVLIVGAGGLGSPAALYLAAAGVGTIGLADFDRVEAHNLQRQIMHGTADLDHLKTESGLRRIADLNPHVRVLTHEEGVQPENAKDLFSNFDIILDGSDNFSTRYLNTDAAFLAGRPLVYGSIFKFEGQVTVFDPHSGGPCYRCLFPEPPPPGAVPNCGEAGVLGALCGVIGSLQAMEVIKYLAGIGDSLVGRLMVFDALAMNFRTVNLRKDPNCPLCAKTGSIRTIEASRYDFSCANESESAHEETNQNGHANGTTPMEISVPEAAALSESGAALILDVREPYELNVCKVSQFEHIPMGQIPARLESIPKDKHLLVLCHHGTRSMNVTRFLRAQGLENVSNIRGGIEAWAREIDPTMKRY